MWENVKNTSKWVLWVLAAAAIFVILYFIKGILTNTPDDNLTVDELVPQPLRDKVDEAHEQVLITKAKAKAKEEEQQRRLSKIMDQDDQRKRLTDLADFMQSQ